MATTTNYGWTTPDDTALVKDGAAAIRTLGSSVDTTTKALNPSTTLGDIEYRSSTANTNTRLGIGTTGQILTVAGGVPSWATAATPASGLTFITSTTFTNTTGANIDSIFSSSYENYLIILDDLACVGGTSYIALQFRYSGTTQTTGYYTSNFAYNTSNATSLNGKNDGATYVVGNVGQTAGLLGSAEFYVSNVGNASECPTVRGVFTSPSLANTGVFGGRVTAQTYTGIRVLTDPTVGNQLNISGRITVYGLAKA